MGAGQPNDGRSVNEMETRERVVAPGRPPRRLDRDHIAAIIQQIPSDSYSLLLWRPDPASGISRPRRGVITDVDGHEVLSLIDGDEALLQLDDIDEILRHFDISFPDTPIVAPPRHRLRHGLLLASPGIRTRLASTAGEGAVRILAGTATLRPASGTAEAIRRGTVTFGVGAVLPRHPGIARTIEVGAETLVATTFEAVPRHPFDNLRAEAAALAATVRARFVNPAGIGRGEAGAIEFRLTRARSPALGLP
jgi:hypothetical protein